MRTPAVLLAVAMLAGLTAGQSDPTPDEVLVRIETAFGNIDLAIDVKRAPITAGNFLKFVEGGFYEAAAFIAQRVQTTTNSSCPTAPCWKSSWGHQPGARGRANPAMPSSGPVSPG